MFIFVSFFNFFSGCIVPGKGYIRLISKVHFLHIFTFSLNLEGTGCLSWQSILEDFICGYILLICEYLHLLQTIQNPLSRGIFLCFILSKAESFELTILWCSLNGGLNWTESTSSAMSIHVEEKCHLLKYQWINTFIIYQKDNIARVSFLSYLIWNFQVVAKNDIETFNIQ